MAAEGFRGAGMARESPTLAHIVAMGGNQDDTRGRPGISPDATTGHRTHTPPEWDSAARKDGTQISRIGRHNSNRGGVVIRTTHELVPESPSSETGTLIRRRLHGGTTRWCCCCCCCEKEGREDSPTSSSSSFSSSLLLLLLRLLS